MLVTTMCSYAGSLIFTFNLNIFGQQRVILGVPEVLVMKGNFVSGTLWVAQSFRLGGILNKTLAFANQIPSEKPCS